MKVIEERGQVHGNFFDHAGIAQDLKNIMQATDNWPQLDDDIKEALEMIQHKIARILNGNPNYIDNYRDVAGYATLIQKRLEVTTGAVDSTTEYTNV